ncbi:hypothetical protein [Vibrio cincinnatiensis]|nr:hypothetical protein [Vibrio cincinnatiensis]
MIKLVSPHLSIRSVALLTGNSMAAYSNLNGQTAANEYVPKH